MLRDDARGGKDARYNRSRHDDIQYELKSNLIGADAYTSGSDPLVLSDNQRLGMEAGSAVDGVSSIARDIGLASRPLGRKGGAGKTPSPGGSGKGPRKSREDVISGLNQNVPHGSSQEAEGLREAFKKQGEKVLEWKKKRDSETMPFSGE